MHLGVDMPAPEGTPVVAACAGTASVTETTVTHIVTTCPKALVKPFTVWKIMHKRWGMENGVFHEAKTYCSFEHCFIHHEVATEVFWMLQVITLNLMRLFMRWASTERKVTMPEVADAIFATLLQLPEPMFKPSG